MGNTRRHHRLGHAALGLGLWRGGGRPAGRLQLQLHLDQHRHHRGRGRVLLVGTFHGKAGQYKTIQAAVDAARSGDWILVAPGDYHETADETTPPTDTDTGVLRRGAHHHLEASTCGG